MIKNQILSANLQPFSDKKNFEYDNLFIRRVYQILKLPLVPHKKVVSRIVSEHLRQDIVDKLYKATLHKSGEYIEFETRLQLNNAVNAYVHK